MKQQIARCVNKKVFRSEEGFESWKRRQSLSRGKTIIDPGICFLY